VRITGGIHKGRKLLEFKSPGIRPTSDRVREAVFNLLGQDFTGKRVIDLFAGTGAFGIDAVSRGAARAIFVDYSTQAVALIRRNIALLALENMTSVVKADLVANIDFGKHPHISGRFDIAFMDPPYRSGLIQPVLLRLRAGDMLVPDACIVAESSKSEPPPTVIKGLIPFKEKTYGDTRISIFFHEDKR
jgi:16S rRNA (guanine966-N2)-methyltransferase